MLTRAELEADRDAIDDLLARAFAGGPSEPPPEVTLVRELRDGPAWIPQQSLVAERDDEIVGYCLCTRAHVEETPVLALGPIGVMPHRQRQGIGTALVHEAVDIANEMGEHLIGLVGDFAYYRRFGFIAATEVGISAPDPAWGQYFQVLTLDARRSMAGKFVYAEPFSRLT